ncbi:hypothetical protein PROFUN_08806 [Planoprotostelium fungivorum]|uniref:Uncharacterized protein n=1 Tax=Planoprotostelium fungivorum TaxID=1890364 RepID=A0A2P6MVS6_9EUKA|nr:hypothetical protein PROFUN_08806 [Planoprotostelium fungivorum]
MNDLQSPIPTRPPVAKEETKDITTLSKPKPLINSQNNNNCVTPSTRATFTTPSKLQTRPPTHNRHLRNTKYPYHNQTILTPLIFKRIYHQWILDASRWARQHSPITSYSVSNNILVETLYQEDEWSSALTRPQSGLFEALLYSLDG